LFRKFSEKTGTRIIGNKLIWFFLKLHDTARIEEPCLGFPVPLLVGIGIPVLIAGCVAFGLWVECQKTLSDKHTLTPEKNKRRRLRFYEA
jgi:hypothetical protein